jgi:predicted RNase H-like HicB family nuclease
LESNGFGDALHIQLINGFNVYLQKKSTMVYNFSAEIIWDEDVRQYIGIVPGLPGAHTQAVTIDELHKNLQDVVRLCLQELTDEEKAELPKFIGTHTISIAV